MTLAVKDANGVTQTIPTPNANGQATSANSAPVVIASDQGALAVAVAGLPLPAGAAQDGSDASGVTPPSGASGIRGWLSGIYGRLSAPLAVTGAFWPASQAVTLSALPALSAGSATIGTVLGPLPASPITGQKTLATSAAALPANSLVNGLTVTAFATNSANCWIGAAGVTATSGYPLAPGQSMSFAVANASGVFVLGANGTDKIAFAGN